MSQRASVLITGPVGRTDVYLAAAQRAGWQAQAFEYFSIVPREFSLSDLPKNVDCLCITSKHALFVLEGLVEHLRQTQLAAVGERTTAYARQMGFESVREPSRNAQELAATIAKTMAPGSEILWPRGSLSDEFAEDLRRAGFLVHDPIVYVNTPLAASEQTPDLKDTGAVFFASPSAVRVFLERHSDDRCLASIDAIAIGATTAKALECKTALFRSLQALRAPTPEALTDQLRMSASPDNS